MEIIVIFFVLDIIGRFMVFIFVWYKIRRVFGGFRRLER